MKVVLRLHALKRTPEGAAGGGVCSEEQWPRRRCETKNMKGWLVQGHPGARPIWNRGVVLGEKGDH